MKLYYSEASPFARRVRVVAEEKAIPLTLIPTAPFDNDAEFLRVNPLGRIPAMVTAEGGHLDDSSVMCDYLDSLKPEPELIPNNRQARIAMMERDVLAVGMMEAAVKLVIESRRPEGTTWPIWQERQRSAILRTASWFEQHPPAGALLLDQISLGVALAYVDFRFPEIDWRGHAPAIARWYAAFSERPSMAKTQSL